MLPMHVGICGFPTSGKSTAAEILKSEFGYAIADDGLPLREIAMKYLGLTRTQCFTQEGKLENIMLNGREWQVRGILGEIGNAFEEKFGADIIPMITHATLDPNLRYASGSVRRDQGRYWKEHGSVIIEIVRPGVAPSPFEFDHYNPEWVDHTILNDGGDDWHEVLFERLVEALRLS